MFCNKCGAALPNRGYICKFCGAMMSPEQIKSLKEMLSNQDKDKFQVNFVSDKYSDTPINRDYKKRKENKFLGALVIILVLIILIIIAILKVM